jgi:hypothetical protein
MCDDQISSRKSQREIDWPFSGHRSTDIPQLLFSQTPVTKAVLLQDSGSHKRRGIVNACILPAVEETRLAAGEPRLWSRLCQDKHVTSMAYAQGLAQPSPLLMRLYIINMKEEL